MEIFKNNTIKLIIIAILFLGCDTIYNLQTKEVNLKVTAYPNEIIHIKGVSFAYPTLNKIKLINKSKEKNGKLLLLLNSDIPKKETLNYIYKTPLDSLIRKKSFFDIDSSRFYILGLINFNEKDTIYHKLDRPIVHPNNYVFAIPSDSVLDIAISFEFQRLGDSITPKIKKIKI